jgi:tetratricopeptide (TPR) repeat protein
MGRSTGIGVVVIAATAFFECAGAATSCEVKAGKFVSLEGAVEVAHADSEDWQSAKLESSLCEQDSIRVGENSRAAVALVNDAVLRLDQNTTMRLTDVSDQPEERTFLKLVVGAFKSFSRAPRTLTVHTPYVNGMIEGTEFAMRVEGDKTQVSVYEGKVNTANDKGSVLLTRGQSAVAQAGKPPQAYVMVNPRDAVQWTLYYPPVLAALGGGAGRSSASLPGPVKQAFDLAAQGDTAAAIERLQRLPEAARDAKFHSYRAALLLNVGRTEEARADIETALAKDPGDGLAYALRSVIELAQNQREKALADAEKAVSLGKSPAAWIALSYAQQSLFRIEAARDSLLAASSQHPDDALVYARLAEVLLMLGEREKALETAHKAEALAPGLVRAQVVLGFAELAALRPNAASSAFQRAIASASADPLAHFGLGLAQIKNGQLAEGRAEIESAVALDSSNALLRSYLGKAYYEEKRGPLDAQQYSIAEELDPADPTAYLYGAIEKQTTNRPVEALHDLEKSIELNDNRAVYRSRQLLDSDLAARSASIARVYTDLGFQQRGLVEGWKSVNTDPSNYSAHRFLADTYSVLPRHSIARVSELLQSQLLQPLNMTPIQPRLAESNLFLIGSQGPGALAFNEFNPVFNRDGYTFQTSGTVGEHNTYGAEGVLSGIYNQTSVNLAYSHFQSDGVRVNDGIQDDIASAFLQYEVSPSVSLLGEYRHRDVDRGDTQTRFLESDISPTARFQRNSDLFRLGGRYAINAENTIIATAMRAELDVNQWDKQFPSFCCGTGNYTQLTPSKAYGGEIQHLFRSEYIDLISGAGYVNVASQYGINFKGFDPSGTPFEDNLATDTSIEHFNIYSYGHVKPFSNFMLTLGVGYDTVSGDPAYVPGSGNINQVNPKFGMVWNPFAGTTVRAAAFRGIKRTLVADQTLEPTQIGGFNQFYDDVDFSKAWRYGLGVDQKFTQEMFGGIEFSRRDLKVPVIDFSGAAPQTISEKGYEYLGRAYFNWAPHPWTVLSVDYFYEKFDNTDTLFAFADIPVSLETHRVPLTAKFFHPSGLTLGFSSSYIHQQGQFLPQGALDVQAGSDDFWLLDAWVSYRLPKRYGFVSVGVTNLTDQAFKYFEVDEENQFINPGRSIVGRITLALP